MKYNFFSLNNKFNLLIFLGPILTGIFIFVSFSVLLIPARISIPIGVVMSFLIFSLTKYYFSNNYHRKADLIDKTQVNNINRNYILFDESFSKILFITIYSIFLAITFFTTYNPNLFMPWSEFTLVDAAKLSSAMGLSFFIPGYALVSIISRHNELEKILKYILGYFISVLITGLCAYITAAFGFPVLENKNILLCLYTTILVVYAAVSYREVFKRNLLNFSYLKGANYRIISQLSNITVLMVFLSLFSIMIILSYYLFNGTISGDQWFHHGRVLAFISGAFKDIDSTASDYYPSLFSALFSEFIILSGNPSVNAFISVNFLIMLPILTFYFFFKKWLPVGQNRSALIATTLFTLGSGFGWVYALQLAASERLFDQKTILEIFRITTIKSFDLNLANTFFAAPAPYPLSIIALPAGFLLLGLLKVNISSKLKYALIFIVTTVGILAHDEFYLFILISSSLLVIYQLNKSHIIFMSLLSSIIFVFLVDVFLPVKYYTVTVVLGLPLISLTFGFILATWALYTIKERDLLGKLRVKFHGKIVYDKRTSFIVATIIVSVILYLYFFTFIVWDHLTVEQVGIQTDNYGQRDIPWYLFPMKLGIAGFLGLLFILTYLYKKFETEIFVFAVIAIFAFLLAPYYDEYRFGKYIMVAMVGFASLLIFKIICRIRTIRLNKLVGGVFLGVIITTASLSLLMYTGFKDILLNNPDYRLIAGENNRFFPTNSEIKFFSILKNKIVNLKTDNVAVLNKDSGNGLLSEKLMAFVGIPFEKIYHNPLILNASSLPALFQFLGSNDIRYIIISQQDLKNITNYTNPTKYVIANFPRIYEDNSYLVLRVPQLVGPNENPDLALIYEPIDDFQSSPVYSNFQYDNGSIGINSKNVNINKNGSALLFNNETSSKTLWSNLDNKKINFIEADFNIIRQTKPTSKAEVGWKDDTSFFQQGISSQYPNNNVGIKWEDNKSKYSLLLTKAGLELTTKSINMSSETSVLRNQEVTKDEGRWYNLKIFMLKKEIIIFVNDRPRLQFPTGQDIEENMTITKVGITVNGNTAEFNPIKGGQIYNLDNLYYNNSRNVNYILSLLAMSKASYGIFLKPDLSVLSKSIILPFDPTIMSSDNFNRYIESVRMGGTIIVFNSGNTEDGVFSKFLSINSTNLASEFSKITTSNHHSDINISGKARVIKMPPENDLKVVSFYSDKFNRKISPFIIEKKYPSGGKIVYVNSGGFFDYLSNRKSDFLKLTDIGDLLNLNSNGSKSHTSFDRFKSTHQFTKIEKFIGLAELYGNLKINSSSLILYNELNRSETLNLHVNKLVLSKNLKNISFDNTTVKNLKLYGQYTAEVDSSGFLSIPSSNSIYDYLDFHMPIESSIKIKVIPRGYGGVEISLINQSKISTFNFTDDLEIGIQKSDRNSSNDSLNFLIKNADIKFTGNAIIDNPDFSNVLLSGNRFLKVNGTIISQFDHVDDYYEKNDRSLEARFISYLKDVNVTGKTNPYIEKLGVMGDVSYRARNHDVTIPLQEIFSSTQNIILIISVFIISFFVSRLIWSSRLISRV